MNPLHLLIIEDDLIEAADMQESLESEGRFVTALARSTQEVRLALKRKVPDLALVDIRLAGSPHNGIEIAQKYLLPLAVPIVYLTSSTEKPFVEAAQQTHPAAFMFKPFRSKELAIQLELAYLNHNPSPDGLGSQPSESLFLPTKNGKEHIRILKKEVVYMKAAGAYVEVYTRTGHGVGSHVFAMNLKYLAQFFPADQFFRISRFVVVNLDFVERIEKNQLFVSAMEKPIPFPETNHKELMRKLLVVKTP
ncbi:response regulator transcription factor [Persicitalea sp.]|uniref:response regulator transcription factor n=1 Tax=Persicitalea sp. TaxID=3100273 RepID=UPI003593701F